MATLTFSGPTGTPVISLVGSGTYSSLSSYGSGGFGYSIAVNSYQDNNYVSSADGTQEYPGGAASGALPNLKYMDATHAYVANESSGTELQSVNPSEATIKVIADGFGASVSTQNAEFRCSDRTSINNAPSGIICQAFEIITGASGDTSWTSIHGTTSMAFDNQVTASSHEYSLGISVMPSSLGSKLYLYSLSLEAV